MKRTEPPLARQTPEFGLPVVALVANVLAVCALLIVLRSGEGRIRVTVSDPRMPADAPVLVANAASDIRLDTQPVATLGDLEHRLSGRSAAGTSLRLVVGQRVDGPFLARLLQVCARAGFSSVSIEPASVGGAP